MKSIHIEAKTISDAWFQLIYNIFDNSYKQTIQKGSFENEQYRHQYAGASIYIEHPDMDIVPSIPPALGIPSPTTMEYIEDYFAGYLMNPELEENETYRYSSRIHYPMRDEGFFAGLKRKLLNKGQYLPKDTQYERIVDMLKNTPLTNHAVIEIATPRDLDVCVGNDGKVDPPCLRLIDFKVIPPDVLSITVYFRSWDLWAGLPSNLGGIELLKQWVAYYAGLKNGPMYAYSAGLHIYGYQEELAALRSARTKK